VLPLFCLELACPFPRRTNVLANNIQPNIQQDLDDLARRVRDAIEAANSAFRNALRKALDAGAALLEAQAQVPASEWQRWLKDNCFLSMRTAELYMQLARNRETIEAELSRVPGLSLRAARRLISTPKSNPAPKGKRTTAAATMPLETTLAKALRQALSLQAQATDGAIAPGVANALNGLLNRLHAAGLDLHDLHLVIRTRTRARRAA
jgi:hypothetical protein